MNRPYEPPSAHPMRGRKFEPELADVGVRQSIRLQGFDSSSQGGYFLTICLQDRVPLFGTVENGNMVLNGIGRHIVTAWLDLENHYQGVAFDQVVVMPDHVHGIIRIDQNPVGAIHESPLQRNSSSHSNLTTRRGMTVSRLVGRFKMTTAKWINERRCTPGERVWQRNFHDRIIRCDAELERIRTYILDNPRRWWDRRSAQVAVRPEAT